jgi:predicted membrane-bound dolichyl-phosphate-mannose-protein mannosyltransferase
MHPPTRFRVIAGSGCLLVLAALLAAIIRGSLHAPVTAALAAMAADPWGLATLIDVYVGLLLVALWICCVERRNRFRLLWLLTLPVFGNVITLLVLLLRLRHSEDLRSWLLRPLPEAADA